MQSIWDIATALLPAWRDTGLLEADPLESKVTALRIRNVRGANTGTFNKLTMSEVKFQFG